MDHRIKPSLAAAALLSCAIALPAQTGTSPAPKKAHKPARAKVHKITVEEQLAAMQAQQKADHDAMQAQIDALRQQLTAKDSATTAAQESAATAQQQAAAAKAKADASAQQTTALQQTVTTTTANTQASIDTLSTKQAELKKEVDSPMALHYKGITLTPGGFIAGESVWRQRALNADIYTPYNATPFTGSGSAHVSEWVPSARQSRLSLIAAGKAGAFNLKGMVEGDFLSAGTTSNNLQTNSYTFRIRQAWAQAEVGHVIFTGGQMWTLLTEDKKAALAGQEALPMTIDNNFNVGTTWGRQTGFRAAVALSPKFTLAAAAEAAQYQFSASNAPTNFFFGAAGIAPGLNNPSANYTDVLAPDMIVKASFDPGFGHYEIAGVGRFFRDRVYPATSSAANAYNDTKFGGGLLVNARFPVTKMMDLGLHFLGGDGTGRYGASILPDVTVKADGTLAPLRNAQALFSVEVHPTKNFDVYGYAGDEYVQRTTYRNALGTLVGYAPTTASNAGCNFEAIPTAGGTAGYNPGLTTCLGATRNITEGTMGFWYRPYTGPAGKLQLGASYGYLTREAWYGVGGAPHAVNNLVWTSFRYYLP